MGSKLAYVFFVTAFLISSRVYPRAILAATLAMGYPVALLARADERLSIFSGLPIRHKNIICQPLIERIDIRPYLSGVELVVAGGESDRNARPLDYEWVLWLRQQCMENGIHFEFRQCGTHFIKDGKRYTLAVKDLGSQAHKAGIDI